MKIKGKPDWALKDKSVSMKVGFALNPSKSMTLRNSQYTLCRGIDLPNLSPCVRAIYRMIIYLDLPEPLIKIHSGSHMIPNSPNLPICQLYGSLGIDDCGYPLRSHPLVWQWATGWIYLRAHEEAR